MPIVPRRCTHPRTHPTARSCSRARQSSPGSRCQCELATTPNHTESLGTLPALDGSPALCRDPFSRHDAACMACRHDAIGCTSEAARRIPLSTQRTTPGQFEAVPGWAREIAPVSHRRAGLWPPAAVASGPRPRRARPRRAASGHNSIDAELLSPGLSRLNTRRHTDEIAERLSPCRHRCGHGAVTVTMQRHLGR